MRALPKSLAVVAAFLVLVGLVGGMEKAAADGGAITGTVTRALNGEPLGGITVELYDGSFNPMFSTTTDSSGYYAFNWLGTGSFHIHFLASGSYYEEWYDNAPDQGSADPVDVTDGLISSGINAQLEEDGAIGGTVYRAFDDSPLEGIEVDLFESDGTTLEGYAYSASDGTYGFTGLDDGTYYVCFSPAAVYYEQWYDGSADFGGATSLVVAYGQANQAVDAYLEEGGWVSGTVRRASDNAALEGIEVDLYDSSGASLLDFTSSASDGTYTIDGVDPGSYLVFFKPTVSYGTEWYDNAPDLTSADAVSVAASQETPDIDAYLESAGPPWTLSTSTTGSGSITLDPDGGPYAEGTVVQLTAVPDANWHFVGWTGSLAGSDNPDEITMNANKSVTAVFALDTYVLTVNTTGNGTVEKNPSQATYDHGSVVQLTAVPDTGWHFVEWTGDLTGSANPANITMDAAKSVTAVFAVNTYALTANTTGSGSVTRNPSQATYNHGTVVQLTAVPDTNWHFVEWTGDLTGGTNPAEVTMDAAKSVTAVFALNAYTLTVNTTGSGSVTRNPSQATYDHGTVVQLTAVPDAGWHFVEWTGGLTGSANPANITMDAAKTVTAVFSNTWTLSTSTTGSGSVTLDPAGGTYTDGTSVQLTAVPATGWYFVEWTGGLTGSTNPVSLTMDAAKSVTAVFAVNTYALTVNTSGSGTVARSPDQPLYNHGTVVQLTATPGAGYNFVEWTGGLTGSTNPVNITMDAAKTVTAVFAVGTYALTVNTTGSGSVARDPDQAAYDYGTSVQLTAVPDTGWHFVEWTGGLTGSANPTSLTMDAAKTVTAVFAIDTYTLSTGQVGSGSVAKNPGQTTYDYGTLVQLTATPSAGYHFVEWTGDLTGGTNPADITMDGNKTVIANFAINTYSLTVNTTGSGSVTRNPSQATYDHGTVVQLTAVPDAGWHFVEWTGALTGSTNPANITMDAAKSVTAVFSNTWTLSTNTTGSGSVTLDPAGGSYTGGTSVQLTAVPDTGYHFVEWTGALTGSINPVSLTMDADKTVTAVFAVNTYALTANTTGSGTVARSPDQPLYDHGTLVQLTATPGAGYHFVEWTGDLTGSTNPSDITLDAAKSVTAVFAVNTYVLTTNTTGSGSVTRDPNQTDYDHGTVVQLTAVPDAGWHFVEWTGALTGSTNPANITMDAAKTVTAVFSNTWTLATNTTGSGSVTLDPAGGTYADGTSVQLTAVPATGWHFVGWTGDLTGSANPSSLAMDSDQTVTATFAINTYTLAVDATGSGSVAINPGQSTYNYGTVVQLTATPATGWHFVGWTGDLTGSTNPASITMNSARSVTAAFAINTYTVTASVSGGNGTVSPATQAASHGAPASITITPAEGFVIASILDNGSPQTVASPYVIDSVTADHTVVVTFASDISPSAVWYLAEGSTNWGFETYISIENPNAEAVNVALTYMTSTGAVPGPTVAMPAMSQATVGPATTLGAADFSTRVECLEGKTISVDRTMTWLGTGATCPEAHCATGVTAAAGTWYMPEGSANWGFECFLLIQNPNDVEADCTVTWMIEGASPQTTDVTVVPNSRLTIDMAYCIGARDASIKVDSDQPIICERAMYRNHRREGHDSTGTTTAANDYYLAEGSTGWGFTTFVLVQNPNDTAVDVTLTYQAAAGTVPGPTVYMTPNSRITINVNATTVIPGSDPSFSTHIHGSEPIIAERAMYWKGGPDNGEVCHDSIGLSEPHSVWYLADGQTSDGRETWTLVQNPNDVDVNVELTYMTPDGTGNVVVPEIVPAGSRKSFNTLAWTGINGRAAVMVRCTTPGMKIMCERSMYWNNRGTGTDTVGGYSD